MTAKPSQSKQRKVQGRLTAGGSIHGPGKPEWIAGRIESGSEMENLHRGKIRTTTNITKSS